MYQGFWFVDLLVSLLVENQRFLKTNKQVIAPLTPLEIELLFVLIFVL